MDKDKKIEEIAIDASKVDNAVLKRLIQEVKNDGNNHQPHNYNRSHNRHNRGR